MRNAIEPGSWSLSVSVAGHSSSGSGGAIVKGDAKTQPPYGSNLHLDGVQIGAVAETATTMTVTCVSQNCRKPLAIGTEAVATFPLETDGFLVMDRVNASYGDEVRQRLPKVTAAANPPPHKTAQQARLLSITVGSPADNCVRSSTQSRELARTKSGLFDIYVG